MTARLKSLVGAISGFAILLAAGSASPSAQPTPRAGGASGLLGSPPLLRTFRDWVVACDNVLVCRAQVKSYDGSLMIRRDPGPSGALLVVLDGQDPSDGPSIPDISSIRVDGAAAPGGWRLDRDEENARLEDAAASAFVRHIADARVLRYRAGGEDRSVSLDGLKAALLAMDEAQGRVGTVTALARIGTRPAGDVPAAPPLPVLTVPRPPAAPIPASFVARVRQASAEQLRHADCETDAHAIAEDRAYPLNDAEALVMLGCRLYPHAYGYLLLRAPRSDPQRAQAVILPQLPGVDAYENHTGEYPFVEWDAETALLSSMSWSCAHLCGTNIAWTFDGRSFVLAEYLTYQGGGYEMLHLYRTNVRIRR